MNDKSKQTIEKLNGVFYTSHEIVDFLSSWAVENLTVGEILEPSAGDGRFADKIVKLNDSFTVTAVEINNEECQKISKINNTKVINDDFYNFYERIKDKNIKYDVVIGNPPYIRYQFLSEEQRCYQSDILKRNGMHPNKLINAWVAFTVASVELVKPGGKFAFVLPTDILQVSYAKELRSYLFRELKEVNIIRFKEIVFSGIQQNVILLFGIKKECETEEVSFRNINIDNLSQLPKDISQIPFEKYSFKNSDKWRKLLLEKNMLNFYEEEFESKTISFTDLCKTEVGITTGNNNFFVVDSNTINEYDLDSYKMPLIGRSLDAQGLFYTKDDLINNADKGRRIWLLDFNNKVLNKGAALYIKKAEKKGENQRYKLRIRNRWYEVPSIWQPDAFLLRRIGRYPKIVKNNIEATSTDTFHRIKFYEEIDIYKFLVLFYTSPSLLSFELEGRVFGGGALEVLPGDLSNIRLPKVTNDLDYRHISKQIDNKLRGKEDVSEIVKWLDVTIQPFSEFSDKEMEMIYSNWIELSNERNE